MNTNLLKVTDFTIYSWINVVLYPKLSKRYQTIKNYVIDFLTEV